MDVEKESNDEKPACEDLCRLCANTDKQLIPIFQGEGIEHNIAEQISKYLPIITVTKIDKLPLQICYQCTSTLIAWHNFFEQCRVADNRLREILPVDVKLNPDDESYHDYTDDFHDDFEDQPAVEDQTAVKDQTEVKDQVAVSDNVQAEAVLTDATVSDTQPMETSDNEPVIVDTEISPAVTENLTDSRCLQTTEKPGKAPDKCANKPGTRRGRPSRRTKKVVPPPPLVPAPGQVTYVTFAPKYVTVAPTLVAVAPKGVVMAAQPVAVAPKEGAAASKYVAIAPKPVDGVEKRCPIGVCPCVWSNKNECARCAPYNRFACGYCPLVFTQAQLRNAHLRQSHRDRLLEYCMNWMYKNSLKLSDEDLDDESTFPLLSDAEDGATFQCHECGVTFAERASMIKHLRIYKRRQQTTERTDPLLCHHCGGTFDRKVALIAHLRSEHPEIYANPDDDVAPDTERRRNDDYYTCDVCEHIFTRLHALQRHRRAHSCNRHPCAKCRKSFASEAALSAHDARRHRDPLPASVVLRDGRKYLKCEQCPFVCRNERNRMEEHRRLHTGERPFTCETCGKQFRTRALLGVHRRFVHERVRQFACDVCGRRFANRRYVAEHRRIHTGEKPLICDQCGKGFRHSSSLMKHQQYHAGAAKPRRRHACHLCTKCFANPHQLKVHVKRHAGEATHVCAQCGKTFFDQYQLKAHAVVHSDERPYSCKQCNAAFKLRKHLKQHMRTHKYSRMEESGPQSAEDGSLPAEPELMCNFNPLILKRSKASLMPRDRRVYPVRRGVGSIGPDGMAKMVRPWLRFAGEAKSDATGVDAASSSNPGYKVSLRDSSKVTFRGSAKNSLGTLFFAKKPASTPEERSDLLATSPSAPAVPKVKVLKVPNSILKTSDYCPEGGSKSPDPRTAEQPVGQTFLQVIKVQSAVLPGTTKESPLKNKAPPSQEEVTVASAENGSSVLSLKKLEMDGCGSSRKRKMPPDWHILPAIKRISNIEEVKLGNAPESTVELLSQDRLTLRPDPLEKSKSDSCPERSSAKAGSDEPQQLPKSNAGSSSVSSNIILLPTQDSLPTAGSSAAPVRSPATRSPGSQQKRGVWKPRKTLDRLEYDFFPFNRSSNSCLVIDSTFSLKADLESKPVANTSCEKNVDLTDTQKSAPAVQRSDKFVNSQEHNYISTIQSNSLGVQSVVMSSKKYARRRRSKNLASISQRRTNKCIVEPSMPGIELLGPADSGQCGSLTQNIESNVAAELIVSSEENEDTQFQGLDSSLIAEEVELSAAEECDSESSSSSVQVLESVELADKDADSSVRVAVSNTAIEQSASLRATKARYKCNTCSKPFATAYEAKRHEIVVHLEGVRVVNGKLPVDLELVDLEKYRVVVNGEPRFRCDMCGFVAAFKLAFQHHLKMHYKTTTYTCTRCEQSYHLKISLTYHILKAHLNLHRFRCHICGHQFQAGPTLRQHLNTHTGARPYRCEECGYTYQSVSAMYRHTKLQHDTLGRHECADCGAPFSHVNYLNMHWLRMHSKPKIEDGVSVRQKQYQCEVCGEEFRWRRGLRKHMEKRHGAEPVNKDWKRSANTTVGMDDAVEEKFYCASCGKGLRRKPWLVKHILSKHSSQIKGGTVDPAEQQFGQYMCELCGRGFRERHHLSTHKSQRHRGDCVDRQLPKANECRFCEQRFRFPKSLARHIIECHSGRVAGADGCPEPWKQGRSEFVCEPCGRGFELKAAVLRHINEEHREKEGVRVILCSSGGGQS